MPSLSQNERSFTSGEGYLQFTTTYSYYVVAYDAAGNVSTPSASASATTLSADTSHDTTPPVISNIQVSNITETSATISCSARTVLAEQRILFPPEVGRQRSEPTEKWYDS